MSELFIEVRCEELPARFVEPAREGLVRNVLALLQGLEHGQVQSWGSPRRIAVAVAGVAEAKPTEERLVTGPPATPGQVSPAAAGFARKYGVEVGDLEVVQGPKGPVLAVRQRVGGERTAALLARGLEAAILDIAFPKSMRWGSGKVRWARPIHSVVALLGDELIETEVAGVRTGRTTLGHRLYPEPLHVQDSESWRSGLEARRVEPDAAARRRRIQAELAAHAAALGSRVPDMPELIDEVVNLVEWPVVVTATLSPELIQLPPRLLIESMKVHQRVFPLMRGEALDHHFLVVTNHPLAHEPEVAALIAEGNARVLAARFHDARHFYAEDRRHRLEERWGALEGMHWVRKGGTMADRSRRLVALAGVVAPLFGADPEVARRAALLCKCDLATKMVGEFPELQGHVGRLLAARQGEAEPVALAIEEHYLPRHAEDALPTTTAGAALAVADRLDTLVGCFSLDIRPKGSADPLGLRRAANGLLQILRATGVRRPLDGLYATALRIWKAGERDPDEVVLGPDDGVLLDELVDFTLARLRASLQEHAPTEFVDAVLATGDRDVVALDRRLRALAARARTPDFGPLKLTFKRVLGLTKEHPTATWDHALFQDPSEQVLAEAFHGAAQRAEAYARALDYDAALDALAALKAPVDRLFDAVLVMHEDPELRANRLGLLRAIADAFRRVADLTRLSAEG